MNFSYKSAKKEVDYYLKIGSARDLTDKKERIIYRFFEILPGATSWLILFLAVFCSWKAPLYVAIFIICFVIYWLFRILYFSILLSLGYKKMRKHETIDWLKKVKKIPQWQRIYHLVILPMAKEPFEVVYDSFLALSKVDYPKDRLIVVLACEERYKNITKKTAERIKEKFGSKFFRFLITWHPSNIPGEIAGKGANETWGAKKAKELIIDKLKIPYQDIIFSSFDIDTCVFPKYFSCLTYYYLKSDKPTRTSFQPIPLYINNIWQSPAFSRIFAFSSTFWHTMNQERPDKIVTFSSHSMSFQALVEVGFKQVNVVSDDSRIFWQCFLKFNGDYRVQPIYYPLSMDANLAKTFWRTIFNIYKQQRRWAYGVADIPYFLFGFLKNKKIPLRKKIFLSSELFFEHISWAVVSILIFLLGWLPLVLGGPRFSQTLISYNLPKVISRIMTVSNLGLVFAIYLSFLLLPPKPPQYGKYKFVAFAFGWLLLPLSMIVFTSFPALDAQTRLMLGKYMGFWVTEKARK